MLVLHLSNVETGCVGVCCVEIECVTVVDQQAGCHTFLKLKNWIWCASSIGIQDFNVRGKAIEVTWLNLRLLCTVE